MDVLQAPIHPQAGAYRDTVVRAGRLPTLPQIDSKGHPMRGAVAADHRGTRHREQIRDDLRRVYVTNSIEFTDSGGHSPEEPAKHFLYGCSRGVDFLREKHSATLNRRTVFYLPEQLPGGRAHARGKLIVWYRHLCRSQTGDAHTRPC